MQCAIASLQRRVAPLQQSFVPVQTDLARPGWKGDPLPPRPESTRKFLPESAAQLSAQCLAALQAAGLRGPADPGHRPAASALGWALPARWAGSHFYFTVRQQSFEIGIRMAFGADQPDILRHFLWKGVALLAIGLAAGLAAALGLAKAMASILFNVSPYDPLVFIAVPCVIALSSPPAILRPAWRAAKVDPSSLFRTS